MKYDKIWIRVFLIGIALILLFLMIYSGLRILESTVFSNKQVEQVTSKAIVRDGVRYYPRKDMTTILIMGVDREGKVAPSEEPNHGSAVDMVALMVFDEKDKTCTLLALNRDTMVEMPRLNDYGRQTGTRVAQLALSHTYGRGMEDSCENTSKTVSNLLYGIDIDHYFAMNMDAISILNDAVGGVTVNITDDFSKVDPTLTMGEVTLQGKQALKFVQVRKGVSDQLNLSRMKRQEEYMTNFMSVFRERVSESSSFAAHTYEEVADYVVTDMTSKVIVRLMEEYSEYSLKEVLSLKGENVRGEAHYEYYVDEEALDALALQMFFTPRE